MTYAIEKSVPIPARVVLPRRGQGTLMWTFKTMEVGDSVFIAGKKNGEFTSPSTVIGRKFTSRKEEGGTRVWRIQ